MISYAQNHEDVVLARAFDKPAGFYVDVGAASPVIHSVTNHFYQRGWRGINVEPLELWARQLVDARPRDVNLEVGISNRSGVADFFDTTHDATEESTFSAEVADALRARGITPKVRKVAVTTLAAVCQEHADDHIDFLKVDVEGLELEVIRGGDWERFRPSIVVVESTRPGTSEDVGDEVEAFLAGVGYRAVLFDGLNRFYVQSFDDDLRGIISAPANVTDGFEDAEFVEVRESLRDAQRSLRDTERRLALADEELKAAKEREAMLEERLELAKRDVAAARREAGDAETQFRAVREALEELLS